LKLPLTTIVFRAVYPKRFAGQALRRAFLCGKDSQSGQDYDQFLLLQNWHTLHPCK
jgi:hypothetical protein